MSGYHAPRGQFRFRDLHVGDHFVFVGSPSFHSTAKKVSARCYVWSGKKAVLKRGGYTMRTGLMKSCVGSLNVAVEIRGRRSPMKSRRGRGRGPKTFGRRR